MHADFWNDKRPAGVPSSIDINAYRSVVDVFERSCKRFADRPAFIGWGLRDFVFDRHFLARFRDELPQAEVMAFEDAGHYVLEDKHELLVPAIRRFLDAHPLAS